MGLERCEIARPVGRLGPLAGTIATDMPIAAGEFLDRDFHVLTLLAPTRPNGAPEQERQDQHGEGVDHWPSWETWRMPWACI
jgi:hypothetical protein